MKKKMIQGEHGLALKWYFINFMADPSPLATLAIYSIPIEKNYCITFFFPLPLSHSFSLSLQCPNCRMKLVFRCCSIYKMRELDVELKRVASYFFG